MPPRGRPGLSDIAADSALSFATWNSRSLLSPDRPARDRRAAYVRARLGRSSCLCLQETHGGDSGIRILDTDITKGMVIHHSSGPNQATGGVISLLRRSAFAPSAECEQEVLAPGRVLLSRVLVGDSVLAIVNVHNFGLTSAAVSQITALIGRLAARARACPPPLRPHSGWRLELFGAGCVPSQHRLWLRACR